MPGATTIRGLVILRTWGAAVLRLYMYGDGASRHFFGDGHNALPNVGVRNAGAEVSV